MYVWLESLFSVCVSSCALLLVAKLEGELLSFNNKLLSLTLLSTLFLVAENNFKMVNANLLFLASESSHFS